VDVRPFRNDGHAAFYDGSYWGLIDRKGKILVNPKYDNLLSLYDNGLGPYKNASNEIGFINAQREEAIQCQYEEVLPFFANTTIVKDKYYIFIDKEGEPASDKNTYLKYVPISDIINQYLSFPEQLVKSLHLNTINIVNSFLRNLSAISVSTLSFNSGVKDVINYYKIPKSKLPRNTRQEYIQKRISLTGNLEPYRVRVTFSESVLRQDFNSRELVINTRAKIKTIEYSIYTQGMEADQATSLVDNIKLKIESAGFEIDTLKTESSWKENISIYKSDRTTIELSYNSSVINLKIDYSGYF
jgi:hypothetical protein